MLHKLNSGPLEFIHWVHSPSDQRFAPLDLNFAVLPGCVVVGTTHLLVMGARGGAGERHSNCG